MTINDSNVGNQGVSLTLKEGVRVKFVVGRKGIGNLMKEN